MRSFALLGLFLLLAQCTLATSERKECRPFPNPELLAFGNALRCRQNGTVPQAVIVNSSSSADAYMYVACDHDRGWRGYQQKSFGLPGPEITQPDVGCVKFCEAVGDNLIVSDSHYLSSVIATCNDTADDLYHNGRLVGSNSAECFLATGWFEERDYKPRRLTPDSLSPQRFECRKAPPPCTVYPSKGIHFDNSTKMLSCEDPLKAILHNANLYATLQCGRYDRSDVWRVGASSKRFDFGGWLVAEASPTLNVSCVEYCVSTGAGLVTRREGDAVTVSCADPALDLVHDGKYVRDSKASCSVRNGWTANGNETITEDTVTPVQFTCKKACTLPPAAAIRFDQSSKSFACAPAESQSLAKITISSVPYEHLRCDRHGGWKAGDRKVGEPYDELNATCVNYCESTGTAKLFERTPNGVKIVKSDRATVVMRTATGLEVSCAQPGHGLSYKSKQYTSLKCNAYDGWIATSWGEDRVIEKPTERVDFTCEKYNFACDWSFSEYSQFRFDKVTKKLVCAGDAAKAISLWQQIDYEQYLYFLCDEADGWAGKKMANESLENYGYSHKLPTSDECLSYCRTEGRGFRVERVSEGDWEHVRVACPDPTRETLVISTGLNDDSGSYDEVRGGVASCWLNEGWYAGEQRIVGGKLIDTSDGKVTFACKTDPTTTIPTTTTTRRQAGTRPTEAPVANAEAHTLTIICASIGGIALLAIVLTIVLCALKIQKRPERFNDEASSERSQR